MESYSYSFERKKEVVTDDQDISAFIETLDEIRMQAIYAQIQIITNEVLKHAQRESEKIKINLLSTATIAQLKKCKTRVDLLNELKKILPIHLLETPANKYFYKLNDLIPKRPEFIPESIVNIFDQIYRSSMKRISLSDVLDLLITTELINWEFQKRTKTKNKEKQILTRMSTSQIDIRRALAGDMKCFVKTIEINSGEEKEIKIIVNLGIRQLDFDCLSEFLALLSGIKNYRLYAYYSGTLSTWNHYKPIDQLSSDEIKELLSAENQDVKDYYILDYNELLRFGRKYQKKLFIQLQNHLFIELAYLTTTNYKEFNEIINKYLDELKDELDLKLYSEKDERKAIEILKLRPKTEKLTIESLGEGSDKVVSFTFPPAVKNVKHLTLGLWSCTQYNNLHYFENLESLELTGINSALKSIDLTSLSKLKRLKVSSKSDIVDFSETILSDLKLTSKQKHIEIDFSKATIKNLETIQLIHSLKANGFNVIVNQTKLDMAILEIRNERHKSKLNATCDLNTVGSSKERIFENTIMNANGTVSQREYRVEVGGIELDDNGVKLKPFVLSLETSVKIDLSEIKKTDRSQFNRNLVKELDEETKNSFLGKISLELNDTDWVPIPSLTANDELVRLDKETLEEISANGLDLEIRFAPETQQYFCKLKGDDSANKQKIFDLYYAMSPRLKKQELEQEPLAIPELLSNAINLLIKHATAEHKETGEIQDCLIRIEALKRDLDEGNLIDGLRSFCSSFQEKPVSDEVREYIKKFLQYEGILEESIHDLITVMFSGAGVCRHSSIIFTALGNLYKLPSRVVANQHHAYVEYFANGIWNKLDLGGGIVWNAKSINHWESQNVSVVESVEECEKKVDRDEENKTEEHSEESPGEFKDLFLIEKILLDDKKGFEHWKQELLTKVQGNPLLEFDHDNDAWNLHQHFINTHQLGEDYLYIHHPSDFNKLLNQLEAQKDGACYEIKGPLLKMIENNKGTLLVNWSSFSERQITNFKSMLDAHPSLQGFKLGTGIKIINICKTNTKACSAFYSRTVPVVWPNNLKIIPPRELKSRLEDQAEAVDLFASRDWEDLLIGKFLIEGDKYQYQPGALFQALLDKKKFLTITGCPKSKSFRNFVERLQRERGFYANGHWHPLPVDFDFDIAMNPPTPIHLQEFKEPVKTEKVFYINNQTINHFFHLHSISEGKAVRSPALLTEIRESDKLVITDSSTQKKCRRLQAELKNSFPLYVLPKIQEIKAIPLDTIKSSTVVLTNDVNAAARQIAKETDIVIDISASTEFSDLFEKTELVTTEKNKKKSLFGKTSLQFKHTIFDIFTKLSKGTTVILKGNISSELYHQVETAFSPNPYLVVNGIKTPLAGKLILVTPEKKNHRHFFKGAVNQSRHEFTWDNTQNYLMTKLKITDTEAKKLRDRIELFFHAADKVNHNGKVAPPKLLLTEDRVLQIAEAMQINSYRSNPIKFIFHQNYTEDPEIYAYLSVMAKLYLSDNVSAYVNHTKLAEKKQSHNSVWQCLDCLSPNKLKNINALRENRKPTQEEMEEIFSSLSDIPSKEMKSLAPRDKRQLSKVHELLKTYPFIELRGSQGTGKTFLLEHEFKKDATFWGEEKIIDWLTSKTIPNYLLLDEANMKLPGHWDFLQGLIHGKIFYQGQFYDVSPETHKVIFTGNPENYPGRYYHDFLQQVPKVHFKSHTDKFLSEEIIKPTLNALGFNDSLIVDEICRCWIACYHFMKQQFPYESIGLRDIKSMLDHFVSMPDLNKINALNFAHLATIEVFSGLFRNQTSRTTGLVEFQRIFNVSHPEFIKLPTPTDDYILPENRQLLWHSVNRCLDLRQKAKRGFKNTRGGILIEGPSGVGKSEMMLQVLKHHGFKEYVPNQEEKETASDVYFHVTMGSENISEIILKAYQMGMPIVIDELNLLTDKDQELLLHLLESRLPDGVKTACPGFMVFASQNSQAQGGRKKLSHALLSRLDRYYEEPYTTDDLFEISMKSTRFKEQEKAHQFVDRFYTQHKKHPQKINHRNFFVELIKRPKSDVNSNGEEMNHKAF